MHSSEPSSILPLVDTAGLGTADQQPEKAGELSFISPEVVAAKRFYLDLDPPRHQPLVVVCGGIEHCSASYSVHRSNVEFCGIEYVAQGSGELVVNGVTHALRPGRVFSYDRNVPHHIAGAADDALVKYFVSFAGKDAGRLLESCGLRPGSVTQVLPADILRPLFDELVRSGLRGRGSAQLCARILECIALELAQSNAPLEEVSAPALATYRRCCRHIEQNFVRLATLGEIAAECHVSPPYICRLFRTYHRQTPYQYLLRLKMSYAAEILQRGCTLIKDAAQAVGFSDPFHFSRVFRNVLGVSPSEFRRSR